MSLKKQLQTQMGNGASYICKLPCRTGLSAFFYICCSLGSVPSGHRLQTSPQSAAVNQLQIALKRTLLHSQVDQKNAKAQNERRKGEERVSLSKAGSRCCLLTSTLSSCALPLLTPPICQQGLVILLHCPVVYTELGLVYRVLLMDWINGNAI